MGSSLRVLILSVGVLTACGYAAPSLAQPQSSQNPVKTDSKAILGMGDRVFAPRAQFASADGASAKAASVPSGGLSGVVPEAIDLTPQSLVSSQSGKQTAVLSMPNAVEPGKILGRPAVQTSVQVAQAKVSPGDSVSPMSPQDSEQLQRSLETPTSTSPPPASSPTPAVETSIPAAPSSSKPLGPAKPGAAPEYLNPPANPLYFPTKAEEVKLQGIQPISLQQAIELAERSNTTLREQRLILDSSRAALREAQSANFPTLNFQAGLSNAQSASGQLSEEERRRNNLSSLFQQGNQDEAATNLTGSLTLNYNLFTSGQRPAQIRAAERQARASELQVETTLQQLRLDVTSAYYDLQEADESVRINESAVRNAQASLDDAKSLERAGLGTRFDVLRSEVQKADALQRLTNAKSQQQIARRTLANRLNIAPTLDLAAADPVVLAGTWDPSVEDTIVLAFKNRSELEEQLVRREAAKFLRKVEMSALGPRLSLAAQYNVLDSYDDSLGLADGYSLSANIQWSLFDGGQARARAAQRDVEAQVAETRFSRLRGDVRFQVEQAYSSLRSNFENIQTTTTALEQAKEALRLARLRFQAGVGTQTDVINAETDLTRAEGNRVTAILGYNRALAQVQRAVSNTPTIATTPPASTPETP